MKHFPQYFTALVCSIALSGCALTFVEKSKKYSDPDADKPLNAVTFSIYQGKVLPGRTVFYDKPINETIDEITPLLRERLPIVFALNGIAVKESNVPGYAMTVTQQSARYESYGGHIDLYMFVSLSYLSNAKPKPIWSTSVRFRRMGFSQVNKSVADKFAVALLERMAEDGVIPKKAGGFVVPGSSD